MLITIAKFAVVLGVMTELAVIMGKYLARVFNILHILSILLIPAALTYTFGSMLMET